MAEFYKIRRDLVFKTIFGNKKNWDLLKILIEEVIHEEVEIERILLTELNNDKVKIRRKILDVVVKTRHDKINIEINSSNYNYFKRRNAAFVFKLYSDSIDTGESYNDMDRIIQINLSVEQKDAPHFPLIGEYTLHDKKLNRDYIDNFKIYEINITEMARLCYNGKKEMCLLGMLDMSQKELENINGDKHMAKLKNEAIKVNNDDEIIKFINKSINDVKLLVPKINPCKIIIDYGGANAAKALHVGHMRSANIGEGLNRLARIFGNEVISDVHLGDLGRQSGMLISEIKKRNPELCFFDKDYKGEYPKLDITSKMLGEYYSIASMSAKEDEKRMEEVREITSLVESGYPPHLNLWKQIVEVSSKDIKNTYLLLNTRFDLWEGEMDSIKYTDKVLEYVKDYMYPSEGAMVVDVKEEGDKLDIPPMIIINRNGATNYNQYYV